MLADTKAPNTSQEKDSDKSYIIAADQLIEGQELIPGAYGDIYRGLYLTQQVVIKKFNSYAYWGANSKAAEILKIDLTTLVSFNHKNIVKCYGACLDVASVCIVMPYYPHGDLMSYLTSNQNITWVRRMKIAHGVARGVKYLHEVADIIHGQLKCANILLTEHKRPVIADYGLTRVRDAMSSCIDDPEFDPSKIIYGPGLCAPYWFAPEMLGDKPSPPTKAADIHALGLIFNELSTREISFKNLMALRVFVAIIKNEMPKTNQEAPPKFNTLIHLCWLRDPQERPTISQVVKEIKEIRAQFK